MGAVGFWRSLVTTADNQSTCMVRVLTILVIVVMCVIEAIDVLWRGAAFDVAQFALGTGGLITAGAAGVQIKKGTEPGDVLK